MATKRKRATRRKKAETGRWRNRIVRSGSADPDKLVANPLNWRVHPKHQRRALGAVLDEVGWVKQVIVNRTTGRIIDGHLRVALALERGEKRVPVDYVELDENEEAIILATFDPISAMAGADEDVLQELSRLIETDNEDLEALLSGMLQEDEEEAEPPEKTRSRALVRKWGVKSGQLWSAGPHRLLVGDSSKAASYKRLMGPEKAAMVFTDPPYGVDYKARSGRFEGIANDELTGDALVRFLASTLKHAVRSTRQDGAFYIWHASSTRREFQDALRSVGLEERQYLMWIKPAAVLGWGDYRWAHEPCFYASKAGETPTFYGDRTNSTTWYARQSSPEAVAVAVGSGVVLSDGSGSTLHITKKPPKNKRVRSIRLSDGAPAWLYTRDGQDDVWEIGRERRQEHPTEKPTELARRAIENSTQEGEVVLDIFAGSGGTLIAAQQTGRRARGIELDPGYAAETLERLSEMGLSPILEDSDGSQEAEG